MKKLFFAALALVMVACTKGNTQYPLEGIQWITEEIEDANGNYRSIWDIGKTQPGKLYIMTLYCEDSGSYKEGDYVVEEPVNKYTYNQETGVFTIEGFIPMSMAVSFMDQNTMVMNLLGLKTVYTSSSKYYNPKKATPSEPEEFKITPDKTADWAGGSISFSANAEVETWSCEPLYPEAGANYGQSRLPSITDDGVLTFGRHFIALTGGEYDNVDMDIKVTAKSVSGETATSVVKSKFWEWLLTDTNESGEKLYNNNINRGDEFCIGLFDADDKMIEGWHEDNSGWNWESNCAKAFGNTPYYLYLGISSTLPPLDSYAMISITYGVEKQDIDFYFK